jgi:hypothetical protein
MKLALCLGTVSGLALTTATYATPSESVDEAIHNTAPLVHKLHNGDYQVSDIDLGLFGSSPHTELVNPPVTDPGEDAVANWVGNSLRVLEEDLPSLIEKLQHIEQHPELTEDGLVAVFEDFVTTLNRSLPTHALVTESVDVTREGLRSLHDKLVQVAHDLDRLNLGGQRVSLIEKAWPLAFGSDVCAERVSRVLAANANGGLSAAAARRQIDRLEARCSSDADKGQLRQRMLAPPSQDLSAGSQSSLVAQNSSSELPVLQGLLDFGALGAVIGELGDNVLQIVNDLTAGEGINLANLNGTTRALYDYTGTAGLPFAWLQIGDSTLPFIPGTALPLVTPGPKGLELLIVRVEPSLALGGSDNGGLVQGLASGSLIFNTEIRVIIERPMAKHLVEMIQNQELLRGLLETQAAGAVQTVARQTGRLLGRLAPVTAPVLDAPLDELLNDVAAGDVSAVIEWILRRFPSVIALVPGGEIVPVSGEDIASLLGYDIRQEFADGEGVCNTLPLSATAYVQLDRDSNGQIFFTRFSGELPQRIDVTVGTDAGLTSGLSGDIAVGAALQLTPVCTTSPLDADLKALLADLDGSLNTNLVGLVEELIPPVEPTDDFVPVVFDPPAEGESRQGPFSAVPSGPSLELSAGLMRNAFVLEEADAEYSRIALQFIVDEQFTLGLKAGISDGKIFAEAGTTPKVYLALAAYTRNLLNQFPIPIINDDDERLLTVLQMFGLGEGLRVEVGADPSGADGLFGEFQLADPIQEVNLAIPLLAGIRAQFGIFNFPELVGICLAPGNICPNTGYDSQHQDVLAAFRMELSEEAYPYFAVLTKDAGVVLGSFMTKLGTWLGFNFEQPFDRANRFFFGVDTDGFPVGGETAIIRCGDQIDDPNAAGDGVCDTVFGLSIGGWAKGKAVEFIDPFNVETLQALVNEVLAFFTNLGTAVFDIFSALVNDVLLVVAAQVGDAVNGVLNAAGGLISVVFNAIDISLGDGFSLDTGAIRNYFQNLFNDFPVSFSLDAFDNFISIAENGFNAIIDAFSVDVTAFSPIQLYGSIGCTEERTGIDLNLSLLVPDFDNLVNSVLAPIAGLPIELPGILGEATNGADAFVNSLSDIIVGVICTGAPATNPLGINLLLNDGLLTGTSDAAGGLLSGVPLLGSGLESLLSEDGVLGSIAEIDELLGPVDGLVGGVLGGNALIPDPVLELVAAALGDESAGSPVDPARLVLVVNDLIDPRAGGGLSVSPTAILDSAQSLLDADIDLGAVPGAELLLAAVFDGTGELLEIPLDQLPLVGGLLSPAQDILQGLPLDQLRELLVLSDALTPVRDISDQVFELTESEAVQAILLGAEAGLSQFVLIPVSNQLGQIAPLLVPLGLDQLADTLTTTVNPVLNVADQAAQLIGPDLIRPLSTQLDTVLVLVDESPVVLLLSELLENPAVDDGVTLGGAVVDQLLGMDLAEELEGVTLPSS